MEVGMFGAQQFDIRIQVVAILVSLVLMVGTVDLVRRRWLSEVYSIIWLAVGSAILVLALFRNLQEMVAKWIGVYYPPSLIFGILGFLQLGISLHFSTALSRVERQNRVLVQRLALLEQLVLEDRRTESDEFVHLPQCTEEPELIRERLA
jgi:hypothetical protein